MSVIYAQTPTHYPTGGEPMEFTAINILVYIVFPLLLVLIWYMGRNRRNKKREDR